jgi:hypothetical protein
MRTSLKCDFTHNRVLNYVTDGTYLSSDVMINLKSVLSEVRETKSGNRLEKWRGFFVEILSTFIGICYSECTDYHHIVSKLHEL